MIIFDIEGNGLRETISEIYCLSASNLDTKEKYLIYNFKYQFKLDFLRKDYTIYHLCKDSIDYIFKSSDVIIGHNIIDYDIPVIKHFFNINLNNKIIIDTLKLSKLINPDRKLHPNCPTSVEIEGQKKRKKIGPHSLEALGYLIGERKFFIERWEVFDEDIINRCISDVSLNEKILYFLLKEASIDLKDYINYVTTQRGVSCH